MAEQVGICSTSSSWGSEQSPPDKPMVGVAGSHRGRIDSDTEGSSRGGEEVDVETKDFKRLETLQN